MSKRPLPRHGGNWAAHKSRLAQLIRRSAVAVRNGAVGVANVAGASVATSSQWAGWQVGVRGTGTRVYLDCPLPRSLDPFSWSKSLCFLVANYLY